MAALPPYIPTKDALLANWALNFTTLLTAAPTTYGQTAAVASACAATEVLWAAAYALVTSSSTKTKATVAAKNIARTNMLAIIRPVAQQISLNAGVTSGNKTAIGVNPRTSTPAPITAPTTYPVLSVTQSLALTHVISYRDQLASPSVKSKPYGVVQMYLYGLPSTTTVTDPTTMPFLGGKTKTPLSQSWPSADKGMTIYYAARWATRSGLLGPWSPIANFALAG
jgi:hypothetical protein